MPQKLITTDHTKIRAWIERRGGKPVHLRGSAAAGSVGVLRVGFPGDRSAELVEEVAWAAFFAKFEESRLAFLHHEEGRDGLSRFCKFVRRG